MNPKGKRNVRYDESTHQPPVNLILGAKLFGFFCIKTNAPASLVNCKRWRERIVNKCLKIINVNKQFQHFICRPILLFLIGTNLNFNKKMWIHCFQSSYTGLSGKFHVCSCLTSVFLFSRFEIKSFNQVVIQGTCRSLCNVSFRMHISL